MIAFNTVVSILFVNMGDVIKVRIIPMIYIPYDFAIAGCFVSANRY